MIPVIDFKSSNVLEKIRKAYTTVGFAVFTNTLSDKDQTTMNVWFNLMKEFFNNDLEEKNKYKYQAENNLGYSVMGAENVDPTAPKDIKESFNVTFFADKKIICLSFKLLTTKSFILILGVGKKL